jgi:hypothetical protein
LRFRTSWGSVTRRPQNAGGRHRLQHAGYVKAEVTIDGSYVGEVSYIAVRTDQFTQTKNEDLRMPLDGVYVTADDGKTTRMPSQRKY